MIWSQKSGTWISGSAGCCNWSETELQSKDYDSQDPSFIQEKFHTARGSRKVPVKSSALHSLPDIWSSNFQPLPHVVMPGTLTDFGLSPHLNLDHYEGYLNERGKGKLSWERRNSELYVALVITYFLAYQRYVRKLRAI
jgi:hypothetical protein